MVSYSHLFKNVPQFVVIHTVKEFGIVNKAEVDVFLEFCCFFYILVPLLKLFPNYQLGLCMTGSVLNRLSSQNKSTSTCQEL